MIDQVGRVKLLLSKYYLFGAWTGLLAVFVCEEFLGFIISWPWLITWGLMFIVIYVFKLMIILRKEMKGGLI